MPPPRRRTLEAPSGLRALAAGIVGLWAVSAVTALGAFVMAALLSEWEFMMEIREFLGVKLALVIPVVAIGLLLAAAAAPPGELWRRLREWLAAAAPPRVRDRDHRDRDRGRVRARPHGQLGAAAARRARVEEPRRAGTCASIARPRTKEFLVGDPFMVLAFALAAVGLRRWVLPAAMIGAIGQVGPGQLVLAHPHTAVLRADAHGVRARDRVGAGRGAGRAAVVDPSVVGAPGTRVAFGPGLPRGVPDGMSRIVLSGYYGFHNLGDEAVLAATVQELRRLRPDAEITVLSASPGETRRVHGVESVPRAAPGAVLAALRGADLLLCGGGSLFQDATSWRSPWYYLAVLGAGRRLARRTAVYAQGLEPPRRRLVRAGIARVLRAGGSDHGAGPRVARGPRGPRCPAAADGRRGRPVVAAHSGVVSGGDGRASALGRRAVVRPGAAFVGVGGGGAGRDRRRARRVRPPRRAVGALSDAPARGSRRRGGGGRGDWERRGGRPPRARAARDARADRLRRPDGGDAAPRAAVRRRAGRADRAAGVRSEGPGARERTRRTGAAGDRVRACAGPPRRDRGGGGRRRGPGAPARRSVAAPRARGARPVARGGAAVVSRIDILGVEFDPVELDGAVERIVAFAGGRDPHLVVTANVEMVMLARATPEVREILRVSRRHSRGACRRRR